MPKKTNEKEFIVPFNNRGISYFKISNECHKAFARGRKWSSELKIAKGTTKSKNVSSQFLVQQLELKLKFEYSR